MIYNIPSHQQIIHCNKSEQRMIYNIPSPTNKLYIVINQNRG